MKSMEFGERLNLHASRLQAASYSARRAGSDSTSKGSLQKAEHIRITRLRVVRM